MLIEFSWDCRKFRMLAAAKNKIQFHCIKANCVRPIEHLTKPYRKCVQVDVSRRVVQPI